MATRKIHIDPNRGERPIDCGDYAISTGPGSSFLERYPEHHGDRPAVVGAVVQITGSHRTEPSMKGAPQSEPPCNSIGSRRHQIDTRAIHAQPIRALPPARSAVSMSPQRVARC
jgi:hypothetical protein